MLDERRIRRMARLASYESKEGKSDIAISMYFRKDYVSVNTLKTFLWVTIGYVILVALVLLGMLESLMESVTITKVILIMAAIIVGYILIMIIYGTVAKKMYRNQHEDARERVKLFCRDLMALERLYEKESGE